MNWMVKVNLIAARTVADYDDETEAENDGLAEKTRAELADLDDLEV